MDQKRLGRQSLNCRPRMFRSMADVLLAHDEVVRQRIISGNGWAMGEHRAA